MKILRGLLKLIAGLIALAVLGFGVMFWLGGNDVKNFCREATAGLSVEQLASLATKHGIRLRMPGLREESGQYAAIANTSRSYGRHICMVRHNGVTVISALYDYAD